MVWRCAILILVLTVAGIPVLAFPGQATSKLRVVTTTTDLAALAEEIGGDRVEVESLVLGYQDPHRVDAKPSFVLKLRRAELLIVIGLQFETGWLLPLLNQSGHARIQVDANGYLDASRFAEVLEIPSTAITQDQYDVHPLGNPHYWLDPENGRRVAQAIATKLSQMRPNDADYFDQRFEAFSQQLTAEEKKWQAEMQPFHGRKVISYHRSWPNFLKRFELVSAGEIEPRPGSFSRSHTRELIKLMRRENVKIILVEPYFDLKTPENIAWKTGAQVVVMPTSVEGNNEITDYLTLFDYDLAALTNALKASQ